MFVLLFMIEELREAGCPGDQAVLAAVHAWLVTQEASTLDDLREAGDLFQCTGMHAC